MHYVENRVEDVRIAYVGGGSRGWAWGLMSDLVSAGDMSGTVALYDIDRRAAENNAVIGELFNSAEGAVSEWRYRVEDTLDGALKGADFVVISILPGTFREMASDVHTPEKYGIYQSVGDTTGPGGIIRALRTIPMFETIARAIERCCPDAWVINYTNPMTVCVRTLYKTFPKIKAFGCCHEVFGTQGLLAAAYEEITGDERPGRAQVKVNVVGVNHFTWLTSAHYRNVDLFPIYEEFIGRYGKDGYSKGIAQSDYNRRFACDHRVKFDLFRRYGSIAAAGDRHLAEFCEGKWYLGSPEQVRSWGFGLTEVAWRVDDLNNRLEKSRKYLSGELKPIIKRTGEDGVNQMRALSGLRDFVTNVNLPNRGQIADLPEDAVVETNAVFSCDGVRPVVSGALPQRIRGLVSRIVSEQETVAEAGVRRDLGLAFSAFANDPLVTADTVTARRLFDEMVENTREYLTEYIG
ncbi:MAG: alpha-glucosidase/alpha-galactosidase [Clostridia bacterium]|nr:alpha-glucosidase/alpha-galactosidase [Clostridia bacterium]